MSIELQLSDLERRHFDPIARTAFADGELYLFSLTAEPHDDTDILWGVFNRRDGDEILLESSSTDLRSFAAWHPLSRRYRYCRLATRDELRDYTAAITFRDCRCGALR